MIQANVIEELRTLAIEFVYGGDTTVKIVCPFHDDVNPSLSFDTETRKFKCFGCQKQGDIATFLALYSKKTRNEIILYLEDKYGKDENEPSVDPNLIERYHGRIWTAGPLLKALRDRRVTDQIIRKYRLGEDRGRITIPVKNAQGTFVNIRRYLPGASDDQKFTQQKGKKRGKPRLYPIDQLSFDDIVLCGGEVKALAAIPILNANNFGAISITCGEGNWDDTLSIKFKDKRVWLCYDIDAPGLNAAIDVAQRICAFAAEVYIIQLPLSTEEYPHGDLNDYLATDADFMALVLATPRWVPDVLDAELHTDPVDIKLSDLTDPKHTNKRVTVEAVISAVDRRPFLVPKEVEPVCARDQPMCGTCPVFRKPPKSRHIISPESLSLIEMMHTDVDKQREAIRRGLKIPPCKVVSFKATDHYHVEDAMVSPDLVDESTSSMQEAIHAVCVDTPSELNETYALTGTLRPHPKTQRATLIVSKSKTTLDALSRFELGPPGELELFKPSDWTTEAIQERLDDVYADYEANVTNIYKRQDLHILVDLAYHSVLWIPFNGGHKKGWVEVLAVGDSGQGKTDVAQLIQEHYGLGKRIDCKNATVAGILGGLDNIDGRWFVKWGEMPANDRRLVIFEELKGMNQEVLGKLTDMRSSGVAELPKIERRRTHARTRLIVNSNARTAAVGSYGYGINAIVELIGHLEDIRRFDACMIVAKEEVDPNIVHQPKPVYPHTYTREMGRRLVLWSWTLPVERISFKNFGHVQHLSEKLCNEFVDDIPIVDRGTMRLKMARLATALACRTFSTDDGGHSVVVRDCHVDYISEYLRRIYTTQAFGYDRFSHAARKQTIIKDGDKIVTEIKALPFAEDFISSIMATEQIDTRDVQDWCNWPRELASEFISLLVRKNALVRQSASSYRKTPAFIQLLRGIRHEDIARPAHIPEVVKDEF